MITKINEFIKTKTAAATTPVNEEITPAVSSSHKITMTFEVKASEDVNESTSNIQTSILEMISNNALEIENLAISINDVPVEEGILSTLSNIVHNDKKMGEVMTNNLARYINLVTSKKVTKFTDDNDKVVDLSDITKEDLEKAYELGKAAKYYTGDIKFENDKQKRAWDYLKQSAGKSMRFSASGNITPAD